jgi:hypothetical protein
MGPAAGMVAKPAAAVMKEAMRAATRGAEDSERIARIREIPEKARKDLKNLSNK